MYPNPSTTKRWLAQRICGLTWNQNKQNKAKQDTNEMFAQQYLHLFTRNLTQNNVIINENTERQTHRHRLIAIDTGARTYPELVWQKTNAHFVWGKTIGINLIKAPCWYSNLVTIVCTFKFNRIRRMIATWNHLHKHHDVVAAQLNL